MDRVTVRHIDAEDNPMVALKYVEAYLEGMLLVIRLEMQNTRTNRRWYCENAEAGKRTWYEALDALGYDAADQHQNELIDPLLAELTKRRA